MIRTLSLCVITTGFIAISTWTASAVPVPPPTPTCTFGGVDAGTAAGAGVPPVNLSVSTNCAMFGPAPRNDTVANVAADDPFGITTWVLADKSDSSDGDQKFVLNNYTGGATSGAWSVASFAGYKNVMITMKQDVYVAFLINTAYTSGFWSTAGMFINSNNIAQNNSHLSIWYDSTSKCTTDCGGSGSGEVPLPAAVWLLGTAVAGSAGFGAWRRRRASISA